MARIIILCLFLSGCGGEYVKPTHYKEVTKIVWIRTDDPDTMCRQWYSSLPEQNVLGCAYWNKDTCWVVAPQIRYIDDDNTMTLGHEVGHCFLGNYHN